MQRSVFRFKLVSKFNFLVEDFGFVLSGSSLDPADSDTESVVYERPDSKIIIYCSIRDGWGLDVLLENPDFGEFSYHTYLRLVAPEIVGGFGSSLAANDDELFELISLYSNALKEYGLSLLSGDARHWNRLKRAEEQGEGLTHSFDVSDRFCDAAENPNWE